LCVLSADVLDLSHLSGEQTTLFNTIMECAVGRAPPLTPDACAAQLALKSFTSKKADLSTVVELYREAFHMRLGHATDLHYGKLCWTERDAVELAAVLELPDALPALRKLYLSSNRFGDAGVTTLAAAFARGALPHLQRLYLGGNGCGDVGFAALVAALESGALCGLVHLGLTGNLIGDAGAATLSGAIAAHPAGLLRLCETLDLGHNAMREHGVRALATSLDGALTALPALSLLALDGNPGFAKEHQANRDAVKSVIKQRKDARRRGAREQPGEKSRGKDVTKLSVVACPAG
jgi:hypothetical protein